MSAQSADGLLQCYNKGCGQKFKEDENHDSACTYHPGVPVFHDALKGWSCCPKRSTDFTDFLNFPGCTKGLHNPIKPPEPEKKKEKPMAIGEEIIVKAPKPLTHKEIKQRPPDDLPLTQLNVTVGSSLRSLLARLKIKEEVEEKTATTEEETDYENPTEVKIGTVCKNKGCNATYTSTESNFEQCSYHPGFPIFHEGYKFWTCCQRRTSDFDEFLRQEGCRTGDHLWIQTEKKSIVCRHDWHQTGTSVVVSVYAKACVPEKCSFDANQTNLCITLSFENGHSEYQLNLRLYGMIEPARSSVELLGTKAEIKLRKADPVSWVDLQFIEPKKKKEESD